MKEADIRPCCGARDMRVRDTGMAYIRGKVSMKDSASVRCAETSSLVCCQACACPFVSSKWRSIEHDCSVVAQGSVSDAANTVVPGTRHGEGGGDGGIACPVPKQLSFLTASALDALETLLKVRLSSVISNSAASGEV